MATKEFDPQVQQSIEVSPTLDGGMAAPDVQPVDKAGVGAGALAKNVLGSLWAGRGLIGGLAAILLAWFGQQALLASNDFETSTRNYILAIIILIISLTNPPKDFLRFGRKKKAAQDGAGTAVVDPASATTLPHTNGATPTTIDTADIALATPASNGAQGIAQTVDIALPSVPTRKARISPVVAAPEAGSSTANAIAPKQAAPAGSLWERWVAVRARLGWIATVVGLLATFGLAGWSAAVLFQDYTSPLGGWLWAASLVVLLLTFIGAPAWPRGEGLLPGPASDFFAKGIPNIPVRWEWVLVAGMMLLATFLRLYELEYHPGIFGDEGEQGMNVRAIVEGRINEGAPITGQTAPLFGSGWWQVPNLSFYVWSFTIRIFGDSMFGLRMLTVISSLFAVFYIYRIGKLLWGTRAGLIAGMMLTVSPLALQFSKFANVSSTTSTLWVVGSFYLFMALRYRKWTDWLLAGFFWSINLYFYPAGKLIIALLGVVGLYCLIRWRLEFFKRYLLGFVLLGVTFALTFMPYVIFSMKFDNPPWYGFAGRAGETSIFSPQNQAATFARYGIPYDPVWSGSSTLENLKDHTVPFVQVIYQQTRETMDALFRRGDQVFYYRLAEQNRPVFSPFWAVLALLGIAYAAWKAWDARFGIAFLWFGIGLSASILTVDTPNLQRFTGAWPVAMLFPAVLVDRVFAAGWPLNLGLARKWSAIPIVALLGFLTVISYNEYFNEYRATCPYCRDTVQARYAQTLGQDYKAYQMGVGGYDVYFNYGSTRFVAKGVEGVDMLGASNNMPVTDSNGKGLAFIIYNNNYEYLPLIKSFYPMGKVQEQVGGDGVPVFTSIEVTREQLAGTRTVHANYSPSTGNPVARDEPQLGTSANEGLPQGLAFPATGQWQGGLIAPSYGTYTFALSGTASNSKLELDGRVILEQNAGQALDPNALKIDMVLAKGMHDIKLTSTLADANSQVQMLWASAGSPLNPVEATYLWDGNTGGLSGEIGPLQGDALTALDPYGGQVPTQRRSDPFVGFREASVIFPGSYVARWQGKLNIAVEGDYGFTFGMNGAGMVRIDNKTVVGTGPDGAASGAPVHLTPGPHDVELRYASPGGIARIEWMWTPPGQAPEIVPPTVLIPAARSWMRGEIPDAPVVALPPSTPPIGNLVKPEVAFGNNSEMAFPHGVAADRSGNIYVGDRGNSRIVVYSSDGKVLRTWGKAAPVAAEGQAPPPFQPGEFGEINDVGVADDGTVYVFDSTQRVQAFTPDGTFIGTFPPEQLGLYGPNGIGVSGKPTGEKEAGVYIAVTGQNRILHTPTMDSVAGGQRTLVGGLEPIYIDPASGDYLEQPVDVVVDPSGSGKIYVIDLKDRLAELTPPESADQPWTITRQWALPVGKEDGGSRLAMSADGTTVYMADPDRRRVSVIDLATGKISFFGSEGSDDGQFRRPGGIAVDPEGRIVVLDTLNPRVQIFSPDKVK